MRELLPIKWEDYKELPVIVGFPVFYAFSPDGALHIWPFVTKDFPEGFRLWIGGKNEQ